VRRFEDRRALVTGASSGLGTVVARRLAAEGAAVGLLGRDREALERLRREIEVEGGRAAATVADLRQAAEVDAACEELAGELGGVDLLAHVAGALRLGPVPEMEEADWDLLVETNLKSCFLLGRRVIPLMREAGGGAIVNVSSVFAHASSPGAAAYAASKAGVVALTKVMALDHIGDGIRINCVSPGTMLTPMLEAVAAERFPEAPETMLEKVARMHPSGKLVDPEEVASLVLYLLSEEAASIVGAAYVIDGGRLARLGSGAS
jgi:NAD(P)-dependent dehydrogenase (short-subunit alcohol dehydrogenase family)